MDTVDGFWFAVLARLGNTSQPALELIKPPSEPNHLHHLREDPNMAAAKIVSVTIGPMPRPLPEGMGDPMPEVRALFEDGTEQMLFQYYPDEISFTESEFIGLTACEAKALRDRKDVDYLRS